MSLWDVFHSDRLELAKGLSTEEARAGLAAGSIRDDDLVRPSGTSAPWVRVVEVPELAAPPAEPEPEPEPPPEVAPEPPAPADVDRASDLSFPVLAEESPAAPAPIDWNWEDDEDEEDDEEEPPAAAPAARGSDWELGEDDPDLDRPTSSDGGSRVALPSARSRDYDEPEIVDEDDDEDGGVVSLRRAGPQKVEELDLAAMVDVAFQLVLFFLVTATTVLYKTLEIPKPSGEAPPEAVAQGRDRTLDDLKEDYILVEIDAEGAIRIDREPVASNFKTLTERLRTAREKTDRTTMLLSADFATPHRNAVMAYDAANEIGLGIAIAKPTPPAGPPPALRPGVAAGKTGG